MPFPESLLCQELNEMKYLSSLSSRPMHLKAYLLHISQDAGLHHVRNSFPLRVLYVKL